MKIIETIKKFLQERAFSSYMKSKKMCLDVAYGDDDRADELMREMYAGEYTGELPKVYFDCRIREIASPGKEEEY